MSFLELHDISYSHPGMGAKAGERVLHGMSLSLAKGESLGLLGKNGSGKTTLLNVLATVIRPDQGRYLLEGKDIYRHLRDLRHHIVFCEGGPLGFYPRISGLDNIKFFAALKGQFLTSAEAENLLRRVGLEDAAMRKKFHTYSLGMRQRLHLGRLLLEPSLLLLVDEPTNGLDASGVQLVEHLLNHDLQHKAKVMVSHDSEFLARVTHRRVQLQGGHCADV